MRSRETNWALVVTMKNPTHPGQFFRQHCLESRNLSTTEASAILLVHEQELLRLCYAFDPITADLAVRIETAFGVSADRLLSLQASYDLATARQIEHGIDRIDGPNIYDRARVTLRRLGLSVAAWPGRVGLSKREWLYKHGEIGDPSADSGQRSGNVSWIRRAFWFDRYAYFVAAHEAHDDGDKTYYIARAPKRPDFYTLEESISLPDGTSGLIEYDGEHQYQHQKQQPEEALTKFGYWLTTPWTDQLYARAHPESWNMPLPNEVLTFASEQSAYEYMSRVSGREIPPQVLHLAWFFIGLSTFLWQVISWGPTIYKFFASLHWHHF